jgi:hypothetical protein
MAVVEIQPMAYNEFGGSPESFTNTPIALPAGYYYVNRTADNPAPARPAKSATTKTAKPKQKKSKPASKSMQSEPISVSYDGGKTWMQSTSPVEGQNVFRSAAQESAPKQNVSGYDTGRGLEIMDALTQMYPGINPDVAAGVAGNFLYESYGLPNIYEGQTPSNAGSFVPDTGGYGLAQWTGPRREALMAMPNPETLATQMQYFGQENAGPERSAWEATMAAPTLADATRTFATQWERPGVPAIDRRIALANQVRNAYDMRNFAEMQRQAEILSQPAPIIPMPIERNLEYNLMLPRR